MGSSLKVVVQTHTLTHRTDCSTWTTKAVGQLQRHMKLS